MKPLPLVARPAFAHRNLPLLLLQARESVIGRFRPILNAHGVTEQQWRVLRALAERGEMEPREIVTACCLSSPSLTGVLARMHQLGLVARQRVDGDQRRIRMSLAPRGRAIVEAMAPLVEAVYAGIEASVGSDFTDSVFEALDHLVAALGGAGERTVPRAALPCRVRCSPGSERPRAALSGPERPRAAPSGPERP